MPLTSGTRLGPYEILSQLGAGGMGEVYRARDTRLDRTVAIKVLPAQLAADEEFRQRFDREARTISQLSHPHICVLHDVGRDAGVDFLVMEFLEGETLAQRLEKGPIALDEALKIAVDIADALDKAHRAGVVHRDLKPGNVMLTRSGASRQGPPHAKLLDFGLAKSGTVSSGPASMLTSPPTRTTPLTMQGTILGTFQYMAPEQIEGADADVRSDIWAFGCVLFEMLTGQRAFGGKTHASLIGAILKDHPSSVSTAQPTLPPGVDHIVATCLAKDPDERWQSASDLARELKWVAVSRADVMTGAATTAKTTGVRTRERLFWIAAVVVAAAATGFLVTSLRPALANPGGPTTRAMVSLTPEEALIARPNSAGLGAAISADGGSLVYLGSAGGRFRLFLRSMADGHSRPLPETEDAGYPAFSPDSLSVAFVSGRAIRRVVLAGGAPVTVIDGLATVRGLAWGDDNHIYYTPQYGTGLWRVSAEGNGTPEELTVPDRARGEKTHRLPFVLPGSKAVLFVVGNSRDATFDDAHIEVLSLKDRTRKLLVTGGTYPQYVPSGHLLYSHGSTIVAVGFDLDRLEARGSPVVVAEGVLNRPLYGGADFGVSKAGTLVTVPAGNRDDRLLLATDRRGNTEPIRVEPGFGSTSRVSPDGSRLASFVLGATSQIGIGDLRRGGALTKITFEWDNEYPLWTSDNARVVFSSNTGGGSPNLYWQAADGSGTAERLTTSDHVQRAGWHSAPGPVVPYVDLDPVTLTDIWALSLADRKTVPVVKTPFDEDDPALSPDGHWLAYQSNQAGHWEVYVQAYPSNGRRWPISNGGGTSPMWASGGHELIYRNGAAVMAVPIETAPEFRAGAAMKLFDTGDAIQDFLPDGRFLVSRVTQPPPVTSLSLIVNWFDELRRKTATTGK